MVPNHIMFKAGTHGTRSTPSARNTSESSESGLINSDPQIKEPTTENQKSVSQSQSSPESPPRCESQCRETSPIARALANASSVPKTSIPQLKKNSISKTSPIGPPITQVTLSELDYTKFIHKPKLRHDINFDPELRFRPDVDGEKGRKKQDRANHFWKALKEELTDFIVDRPTFYQKHGYADDWTLPLLLKAVREIIQTLVPQGDGQFLDEGLNIELVMQQFHKGTADLEKLASYLSEVLKCHCAPMRDDWVDAMYNQLSNGNRDSNLDELVGGMRSLLSLLEAMKLDMANHQIRCLRPLLIEDTIRFEQKYFFKKMQSGKFDVRAASAWYEAAQARFANSPHQSTHSFGDSGVFFEALSRLILPSTPSGRIPNTFLFDEERLVKLRSDMLDAINFEVCMRMYEDLDRIVRYSASNIFAHARTFDEEILAGGPDSSSSNSCGFNFNTPLSTSRPSKLALSSTASAASAASSPPSSVGVPAHVVAPTAETLDTKTRKLYGSLVSLLQSTDPSMRPTARWASIAPSLALQIFRYTEAPTSVLPTFEDALVASLCDMDSELYKEIEEAFHARLMGDVSRRVQELRALSGVALFYVSTGSRVPGTAPHQRYFESPLSDFNCEGAIDDISIRFTHLGILHLRVWGPLAYVTADEIVQ